MNIEFPHDLATMVIDEIVKHTTETDDRKLRRRLGMAGEGGSLFLDVNELPLESLEKIYAKAKQAEDRSLMVQLSSLINLTKQPFEAKIGQLKALEGGLVAYMKADFIKGWMFHREADGVYLPWLVKSIHYSEGSEHRAPTVTVIFAANTAQNQRRENRRHASETSIHFTRDDIIRKTVPELLAAEDWFHETPELHAQYETDLDTFVAYKGQDYEQFLGSGLGVYEDAHTYSRRLKTTVLEMNCRLINEEPQIERVIIEGIDPVYWRNKKVLEGFDALPYHCRMFVFNLDLHEHHWIHVAYVKPYAYKTDLREKLVLPESHHDLIDILTTDMNAIVNDIVDGKSGGTTILCKGLPGLGKTLTAEVYAEVVKRPLYRVHSGQLGTTAKSIEENLEVVLTRSERWESVLLLDECDQFCRQRGNDMEHNAVVASFLRKMEYFNGLMFMTTNRVDTIDDAILSRCIAVINYELPSSTDAKRIWKVLSTQFELKLDDDLLDRLVSQYPKASGRDIKELLKLTSKFAKVKEKPMDIDLFRQCAMFRGLEPK